MRLPVIFLAIATVCALAACGGGGDNSSGSPTCSSSPRPTPQVGTRANPIPICATLTTGDGWEITVLSTTPDATAQVMAANQFNGAPAAGDQFFIATVQAKRTGTTAAIFNPDSVLRSVGGVTDRDYSTFRNICGSPDQPPGVIPVAGIGDVRPDEIPDAFLTTEPLPGEVVQGNVCWAVDRRDGASLEMYYQFPAGPEARPADGYVACTSPPPATA
jgi:hypothetical protein